MTGKLCGVDGAGSITGTGKQVDVGSKGEFLIQGDTKVADC